MKAVEQGYVALASQKSCFMYKSSGGLARGMKKVKTRGEGHNVRGDMLPSRQGSGGRSVHPCLCRSWL